MKYKNSEGQWQNIPALKGKDGATFTPHVSEDGVLSWTNDKGLENPASVNVKDKVKLDTVLEVEGRAADAKAVGDRITEIENNMPTGITVAQSEQIETNKNDIAQLKTGKADTGHTHAEISEIKEDLGNKLDKSGHTANKYLGTDSSGNVVEKETPTGASKEQIDKSVNEYLAEHPVQGGITTTQLNMLRTLGKYLVFSDASTGQAIFDGLMLEFEKGASDNENGGSGEIPPAEPDVPTPQKYIVTNSLTNVASNNDANSVNAGENYTAVLTANSGYYISNVTITMGTTDVTQSVYSNGTINISEVTGDVLIVAVGAESDNLITAEILNQSGAGNGPDGASFDGLTKKITPLIQVTPNTTYKSNVTRIIPGQEAKEWGQKLYICDSDKKSVRTIQMSANSELTTVIIGENEYYISIAYNTLLKPYFGESGVIV